MKSIHLSVVSDTPQLHKDDQAFGLRFEKQRVFDLDGPDPTKELTSSTKAALVRLDAARVAYSQPNPHHIKVGHINFWPNKGTVFIDGMPSKYKRKGLDFFFEVLRAEGIL